MKRATETWTSSKTKNAFPPGKTDLLQSLHLKKKSYIIKATLRQVNLKLKTVAISLKLLWSLTCCRFENACHTQRTKLFNGKCLTYKQITNSWFSGILPDLNYLLPACRKNEGKEKKNVNSVVSCSTQGNPSASSQHPAHVAGAIECLPTLFPLPAVEPALQNRQRVFRWSFSTRKTKGIID